MAEKSPGATRFYTVSAKTGIVINDASVGNVNYNKTVHYSKDELDKETRRNDEILKESLKKRYLLEENWVTPVRGKTPWMKLPDYYVDPKVQKVHASLSKVVDPTSVSLKEVLDFGYMQVLIEGPPGFGKTSLCCDLAYHWASGRRDRSPLEVDNTLLIYYPLKNYMEGKTIEECLVRYVHSIVVSGDQFRAETELCKTERALKNTKLYFILLLDGYTELSSTGRREIRRLLKTLQSEKDLFRIRMIILTTTHVYNRNFPRYFGVHLQLTGLSRNNMKLFVEKYFVDDPSKSKKDFKLFLRNVCKSCGWIMSPFLLYLLCHLQKCDNTSRDDLVPEKMIPSVVHLFAQRCNQKYGFSETETVRDVNMLLDILLQCHEKKRPQMTLKYLREKLKDSFDFVMDWGILRPTLNNRNIYEPIHQIFVQYRPLQLQVPKPKPRTECYQRTRVTKENFTFQSQFSQSVFFETIWNSEAFDVGDGIRPNGNRTWRGRMYDTLRRVFRHVERLEIVHKYREENSEEIQQTNTLPTPRSKRSILYHGRSYSETEGSFRRLDDDGTFTVLSECKGKQKYEEEENWTFYEKSSFPKRN